MKQYTIGTLVTCSAQFLSAAGAAVVPGDVTFAFIPPSGGAPQSAAVTPVGGGVFTAQVLAAEAGTYQVRFASGSGYIAAGEDRFGVRESPF